MEIVQLEGDLFLDASVYSRFSLEICGNFGMQLMVRLGNSAWEKINCKSFGQKDYKILEIFSICKNYEESFSITLMQ